MKARDYLGNEYPTIAAMCAHYGMNPTTYINRVTRGMTVEEALTTPAVKRNQPKPSRDHLGNEYPSMKAMCEAWGQDYNKYLRRRKAGWSVEKALTTY